MTAARLIVCERSGRWAAAFRRMAADDLPLRETRSFEQVERELEKLPASVAAIEINGVSAARIASQLAAWTTRYSAARFLLLAEADVADSEPELREAGACHVVYSSRELAATVELVRRHLARAPRPELSLEESILAALPWSGANS